MEKKILSLNTGTRLRNMEYMLSGICRRRASATGREWLQLTGQAIVTLAAINELREAVGLRRIRSEKNKRKS